MTDSEFDTAFGLLTTNEVWARLKTRFDAGVLVFVKGLDNKRESVEMYTMGGVICRGLVDHAHSRLDYENQIQFYSDEEHEIPDDSEGGWDADQQ